MELNEKKLVKLSRFLSLVLRHRPEAIGISLDENGWTAVDTLIEKMNSAGVSLSMDLLKHVVATNNKQRFSFNSTLDKIRANQGHSVPIKLEYEAKQPPEVLYHGTSVNSVKTILHSGLDKRKRHHVHLSADIATALKVGGRKGIPFVFEVNAGQMFRDHYEFFLSSNGVWLTEQVPPKYLKKLHS